MKSDAEIHSENSAGSETSVGQEGVREAATATSPTLEASSSPAADPASVEGSGAGHDVSVKNAVGPVDQRAVEASEASPSEKTGGDPQPAHAEAGHDKQTGHAAPSLIAIPSDAAGNTLTDALAALDRRDYATAKRLFEALGRTSAAQAIDNALAALDRKDFATAQSLFEALAAPKSAAPPPDPTGSEPSRKVETRLSTLPLEVVPSVEPDFRDAAPRADKAKERRRTPRLLVAGLALLAILGASAIYASRLTGDHVTAGFASAVDLVKAPLAAITGSSEREQDRSAMRDLSAALTQVTARLDRIEREYGERLDKLGQGADPTPASRLAEMTARLEKLEKRVAAPGAPVAESTDVSARIDKLEKKVGAPTAPASEFAEIRTRLDRLEKKVVAQASPTKGVPAKIVPPATTNSATLVARTEPSASKDAIAPVAPKPLLRNYSVEDVQDGVAMLDSRYGPIQVAPGDLIPGAGRVLRIERHGPDWFVVTSLGVIGSGPAP